MKIFSFASLALLFFVLQANINAFAGELPCKDIDELITNMDKLNNALDKISAEDIDAELDKTLKDVASSLKELGKVVSGLSGPASELQKAYDDKDLKAYQTALDKCADKLDDYYEDNCKK